VVGDNLSLSDLADVLIRTTTERAVAECQKESQGREDVASGQLYSALSRSAKGTDEFVAEIQMEIDPLYLEI
jgi:hypothetical protein